MWFTHYEKHHAETNCIYVHVEQKEKNHMEEEQDEFGQKKAEDW